MVKKIGNIVYGLVLVALFMIAGLVAVSTFNVPGNYKLMVVLSGSMEPTIKTGSIVVVKPEKTYKVGDIITFRDSTQPQITVTHRIFEASGSAYITKGDANKTADTQERLKQNVLGKVIFSIPFLGYPVSFAKTQTGLIILVIIPSVIIIYSELLNIKNEALRLVRERKK